MERLFSTCLDSAQPDSGNSPTVISFAPATPAADRSAALRHRFVASGSRQRQQFRPRVAILVATGVDEEALTLMEIALAVDGASSTLVAPHSGMLVGSKGSVVRVRHRLRSLHSLRFDAVYIPGNADDHAPTLADDLDARAFIQQACRHGKTLAASGNGRALLAACGVNAVTYDAAGPASSPIAEAAAPSAAFAQHFIEAMHRPRADQHESVGATSA